MHHHLAHQTHHYALCNGLLMINKSSKQVQAVPYTLTPQLNLMSKHQFMKVQSLQPVLNQLIHDISTHNQFLRQSLRHVIEEDEFTRKLFEIYVEECEKKNGGYASKIQMGIHRADYMLHYENDENDENNSSGKNSKNQEGILQQVEINTISSAFGALSTKMTEMHHMFHHCLDHSSSSQSSSKVEISASFHNNVKCLFTGHRVFKETQLTSIEKNREENQATVEEPVILFVVQPDEGNFADQRHYEYELFRKYGVRCVRKTLTELANGHAQVDAQTGLLCVAAAHTVDDEKNGAAAAEKNHSKKTEWLLVSVVYYRSGYGPSDYPTEKEWQARRMLESSLAINCPTVAYQLAGTKKVQQVLADREQLAMLVSEQSHVQGLMSTFTGIYALSNPAHASFVADAIAHPESYVLKPQREGGGNLIFGDRMVEMLRDEKQSTANQYILMRRICPRGTRTLFVKDGVVDESLGVSELGIFGTFVGSANQVYLNECSGYLLRTKKEGVEDGGVASGVAVLDSLAFSD